VARHNTRTKATVLLALAPLMLLTGCSSVLGLGPRLAPEDEPYLFDRWDPDFELAKPCEDITDAELEAAGLYRDADADKYLTEVEGRDACSLSTSDDHSVLVSGSAYKIKALAEREVPLDYQPNEAKNPVLAYTQHGATACGIAAETPRGTVEVAFMPWNGSSTEPIDKCPMAEHYFDLLIGEKLNEYRAN